MEQVSYASMPKKSKMDVTVVEGLVPQRRLNRINEMYSGSSLRLEKWTLPLIEPFCPETEPLGLSFVLEDSWSGLPKLVLYSMLPERKSSTDSRSSLKSCVEQDLIKFGLLNSGRNEDVDLEH